MIKIEELQKLPEPLQREVMDYAEYLLQKYHADNREYVRRNWADVKKRGRSSGETASETVLRIREEEIW